jgi:hypothetical protein
MPHPGGGNETARFHQSDCWLMRFLTSIKEPQWQTQVQTSPRWTYLGDAMPTDSTTFRVLSTAVTFVLAFVLSLILFAAAVGYHLN